MTTGKEIRWYEDCPQCERFIKWLRPDGSCPHCNGDLRHIGPFVYDREDKTPTGQNPFEQMGN